MRQFCAFGSPCGAGGIKNDGRVVGHGLSSVKDGRRLIEQRHKVERAAWHVALGCKNDEVVTGLVDIFEALGRLF
jgi:hypothetical protein